MARRMPVLSPVPRLHPNDFKFDLDKAQHYQKMFDEIAGIRLILGRRGDAFEVSETALARKRKQLAAFWKTHTDTDAPPASLSRFSATSVSSFESKGSDHAAHVSREREQKGRGKHSQTVECGGKSNAPSLMVSTHRHIVKRVSPQAPVSRSPERSQPEDTAGDLPQGLRRFIRVPSSRDGGKDDARSRWRFSHAGSVRGNRHYSPDRQYGQLPQRARDGGSEQIRPLVVLSQQLNKMRVQQLPPRGTVATVQPQRVIYVPHSHSHSLTGLDRVVFNGSKDVHEFIMKLKNAIVRNGIPREEALTDVVPFQFEGAAKYWYKLYQPFTSWDDFERQLTKAFSITDQERWRQIKANKWSPKITAHAFIWEVEFKMRFFNETPTEGQKIDAIYDLFPPAICAHIMHPDVETLEDLANRALEVEPLIARAVEHGCHQ